MKPLSFDGLRRLLRGNRDRENQSSQSFKRSNSFKRASFRKSLMKNEKITLPNGVTVKTSATVRRKESVGSRRNSIEERKDDGYYSTDGSARNRSITYDQWLESRNGPATAQLRLSRSTQEQEDLRLNEDSRPSTLSTNRLSLDSGVRHSMDSKTKFAVDPTKRFSLDYKRVHGLDNSFAYEEPRSRKRGFFFKRSSSSDPPVPPARIKSLLSSPRIAPKLEDDYLMYGKEVETSNLRNTPKLKRVLSQPISVPSTPGRPFQRVINKPVCNGTPNHHILRSSLSERERLCAVHGSPAIERVQQNTNVFSIVSPKPTNRWSAIFSNSIFARSPARKTQTLKAKSASSSFSSKHNHRIYSQNDPHNFDKSLYLNQTRLPEFVPDSTRKSPSIIRSHGIYSPTLSDTQCNERLIMDQKFSRVFGGNYNDASHSIYQSPHLLQRNVIRSNVASPAILHRQLSAPTPEVCSPMVNNKSSTHHHSVPNSNRMSESRSSSVLNSSQFYPGKSSIISGLPSISVVGGRSLSSDRDDCTNQKYPVPPVRTHSADRSRTLNSRYSMPNFGRPLSLDFEHTLPLKQDLVSPVSISGEISAKNEKRKRGPSLLVGKTSWFSRNSSVRRPIRQPSRLTSHFRNIDIVEEFEEESADDKSDEEIPPPPPRPARLMTSEDYRKIREQNPETSEPFIIQPHKRKTLSPIKFPKSLWITKNKTTNQNTEPKISHIDLLMPLSQSKDHAYRSVRTESLVQSYMQNDKSFEDLCDTNSEPGCSRYKISSCHKPKSVPGSTRLNLKVTRNTDSILKALGFTSKKSKKEYGDIGKNDEKIITRFLMEQLSTKNPIESNENVCSYFATGNQFSNHTLDSPSESLLSLVSSVMSSRASNCSRKSQRKKHKRVPSVPAYPSLRKVRRGVGATATTARQENGGC